MKLGRLDLRPSAGSHRYGSLSELLRQTGWPTLVGLLAAICGLIMLLAAWHYDQRARHLITLDASAQPGTPGGTPEARQFARATEAIFTIPEDNTHIDDLSRLFRLAKSKGVHIGTVEYRQTPNPSLQVLVRSLDIRIDDDYPKLKGFVAELLGTMPHVSLQEIRVERKDAAVTQGQILLKLAFVYRAPGAPAIQSRAEP